MNHTWAIDSCITKFLLNSIKSRSKPLPFSAKASNSPWTALKNSTVPSPIPKLWALSQWSFPSIHRLSCKFKFPPPKATLPVRKLLIQIELQTTWKSSKPSTLTWYLSSTGSLLSLKSKENHSTKLSPWGHKAQSVLTQSNRLITPESPSLLSTSCCNFILTPTPKISKNNAFTFDILSKSIFHNSTWTSTENTSVWKTLFQSICFRCFHLIWKKRSLLLFGILLFRVRTNQLPELTAFWLC